MSQLPWLVHWVISPARKPTRLVFSFFQHFSTCRRFPTPLPPRPALVPSPSQLSSEIPLSPNLLPLPACFSLGIEDAEFLLNPSVPRARFLFFCSQCSRSTTLLLFSSFFPHSSPFSQSMRSLPSLNPLSSSLSTPSPALLFLRLLRLFW